MRAAVVPLILVLSLLAGCAGQPQKPQGTPPDVAANYDLDTFEGFGEALAESMNHKDTSLFGDRVDAKAFARRSLKSVGLLVVKEDTVNAYAKLMRKALKGRYKNTFAQIKTAHFVRLLPADASGPDEAVGLIRIQPNDGGINYWKVYLHRTDGRIAIVDWFSYTLGDLATRSLGSFILEAGLASVKPDAPGSDAIKAYLKAAQAKDLRKQLRAYERLPERLKSNSLLMFAYAQTSMKVSSDAYQHALAQLSPLYRKSNNYALMLVDFYIQKQQYDKAQRAIDVVAKDIGPDAGLDSLHAGIALQQEKYPQAIAYARDGIRREAGFEDNYWVLLDALVFSKNYKDAVLVLNILEQGFNYRFDAHQMATLAGYEQFSHSQAFQSWQSASAH